MLWEAGALWGASAAWPLPLSTPGGEEVGATDIDPPRQRHLPACQSLQDEQQLAGTLPWHKLYEALVMMTRALEIRDTEYRSERE
jgi:hypothetical protein